MISKLAAMRMNCGRGVTIICLSRFPVSPNRFLQLRAPIVFTLTASNYCDQIRRNVALRLSLLCWNSWKSKWERVGGVCVDGPASHVLLTRKCRSWIGPAGKKVTKNQMLSSCFTAAISQSSPAGFITEIYSVSIFVDPHQQELTNASYKFAVN